MIADKRSGVAPDVLAAVRSGTPLPDNKLQSLSSFVQAMAEARGNPGKPVVDAFLAAGYGEQQVLGVVLAIACKTFSNFVNHLAATPVDKAFEPYAVDWRCKLTRALRQHLEQPKGPCHGGLPTTQDGSSSGRSVPPGD